MRRKKPGCTVLQENEVKMLPKPVGHSRQSGFSFATGVSQPKVEIAEATATPKRSALKKNPTPTASSASTAKVGNSVSRQMGIAPVRGRRSSISQRTAGGTPDPVQLSQLVSNAVKVVTMFYSDTATVEKTREFWEFFYAHMDGLPDRPRLLVFRQKLKGGEVERWWGNSSIRTFATLKVRFHNQFLSRTADELWERSETAKRE
ncbi:hypothetical protein PI124_g17132 [Phytophthora idaei]|nr:hypothetical protein PI124_g17132 [Phytophthora idaei]